MISHPYYDVGHIDVRYSRIKRSHENFLHPMLDTIYAFSEKSSGCVVLLDRFTFTK